MDEFDDYMKKQIEKLRYIMGIPTTFVKVGNYKGLIFEIRPKEKGHNEPHCHAKCQGKEISISLIGDNKILATTLNERQSREAVKWVKENLEELKKYWNKYHYYEMPCY